MKRFAILFTMLTACSSMAVPDDASDASADVTAADTTSADATALDAPADASDAARDASATVDATDTRRPQPDCGVSAVPCSGYFTENATCLQCVRACCEVLPDGTVDPSCCGVYLDGGFPSD